MPPDNRAGLNNSSKMFARQVTINLNHYRGTSLSETINLKFA